MITTNTGTKSVDEAIASVNNPEVQAMMEKLSHFGLAVSIPHMHSSEGEFLPLPDNTLALEEDLRVTFKKRSDLVEKSIVPVQWRWDGDLDSAVVSAGCGLECIVKPPAVD